MIKISRNIWLSSVVTDNIDNIKPRCYSGTQCRLIVYDEMTSLKNDIKITYQIVKACMIFNGLIKYTY